MIPMNVLTVRPTLLTVTHRRQTATARKNNERADYYDCGVWTRLSPVSVSFNVSMTLVIGRVHRWHET